METNGYKISWRLILLEFVLIIVISFSAEYISIKTNISLNTLEVLSQLVILLPIIIGTIILKNKYPYEKMTKSLGLESFDITMLLFFVLMPVGAQYFSSLITAPATFFLSEIFGEYTPAVSAPESVTDFLRLLLVACILAPAFEELLFRGVIMKLLSPYGFLTASVVSSIGFAMLHLSPQGFFVILFLGFTLACIRYISGSVFACMVFHALSNFYSLLMLIFEKEILMMEKEMIIFSIFSAVFFPILFLIYKKTYPTEEHFEITAKKQGFSISFLICIIIFSIYTALLATNKI